MKYDQEGPLFMEVFSNTGVSHFIACSGRYKRSTYVAKTWSLNDFEMPVLRMKSEIML